MKALLVATLASASLIGVITLAQAQQVPEVRPSTTMQRDAGPSGLNVKGTHGYGNPPYVRQRPIEGRTVYVGPHRHWRSRRWFDNHRIYRY